jgi:hypothetical protein
MHYRFSPITQVADWIRVFNWNCGFLPLINQSIFVAVVTVPALDAGKHSADGSQTRLAALNRTDRVFGFLFALFCLRVNMNGP